MLAQLLESKTLEDLWFHVGVIALGVIGLRKCIYKDLRDLLGNAEIGRSHIYQRAIFCSFLSLVVVWPLNYFQVMDCFVAMAKKLL